MDLQPSLLQRTHLGDYRTTATRIDQDFVDSPLARRLPPTGYVTIFCSSQDYHCPKNYTDELSDITQYSVDTDTYRQAHRYIRTQTDTDTHTYGETSTSITAVCWNTPKPT